jgi:hypothetical protein
VEEDKTAPSSAKLPSSNDKTFINIQSIATDQISGRKLQHYLTNSSFSPVKSAGIKKKSIINFPKLPEVKNNILQIGLKKAPSIQKQIDLEPATNSKSPNRRPDSSRKYVRAS